MLKKFRLRRTFSSIRLHFRFQKKITRPSRAKAYANIRWLGSSRASPKSFEKTSRANQNELACPPLARVPVVAQAGFRGWSLELESGVVLTFGVGDWYRGIMRLFL